MPITFIDERGHAVGYDVSLTTLRIYLRNHTGSCAIRYVLPDAPRLTDNSDAT